MSVDVFNKEQFEQAVAPMLGGYVLVCDGYRFNELHYHFVVKSFPSGHQVCVDINSSIGKSGVSDAAGMNSIRAWLTDKDGQPLGSKVQKYVTRVPGWQNRLEDVLDILIQMAEAIEFCSKCQSLEKVFKVKKDGKNKGRLFIKCNCEGSFSWLDVEDESADDAVASDLEQKNKFAEREKELEKLAHMHEMSVEDYKNMQASRFPDSEYTETPLAVLVTPKPQAAIDSEPVCPKCGSPMRRRYRKSDNSPFWGCSNYPDCKATRSINDVPTAAPTVSKPKEFTPSPYQQAIFDWVRDVAGQGESLVVEALAGSGKSTTGVQMLGMLDPNLDIVFCSFGKRITSELRKKAPRHVKVSTLHSLGFAAVRMFYEKDGARIKVEDNKVYQILEDILDKYTHKHLFPTIKKLVSLVKANLVSPTVEEISTLADHHGVELNGDADTVFAAVALVIERCASMTNVIDYDDMCWLPVIQNLPVKKYDVIFIDEAQDTNKNQAALALMSVKETGTVIAVGDRYQSMYGFRGADVDAIPNLIEDLDATTLPLSITYRNPKCVVEMVNQRFPNIPLGAAPWAIEGSIRHVTEQRALLEYRSGDMAICRTNAPLVAPAFALIRNGIKAVIVGRDIGKDLLVLVRRMNAVDITDLVVKVTEYGNTEVTKLLKAEKNTQAQSIQDKVNTIVALSDGVKTLYELEDRIDSVFQDDAEGVVFSSIHRAKGLEAERVFILRPDLLPHPMATKDWEMAQESNIEYVAYTRTLNELVFVGG